LAEAGYDATHVAEVGLLMASDADIFDAAVDGGYVVVTADSDFGALLAMRRAVSPSVIHLRHVAEVRPDDHAALLIANLPAIVDDLARASSFR
jgi:predicted nuclease of predicted toxin-antitoxin system